MLRAAEPKFQTFFRRSLDAMIYYGRRQEEFAWRAVWENVTEFRVLVMDCTVRDSMNF